MLLIYSFVLLGSREEVIQNAFTIERRSILRFICCLRIEPVGQKWVAAMLRSDPKLNLAIYIGLLQRVFLCPGCYQVKRSHIQSMIDRNQFINATITSACRGPQSRSAASWPDASYRPVYRLRYARDIAPALKDAYSPGFNSY